MYKRVCAVYFSPTGTTKKVVNTISKVLGDKTSLPVEIFDFTLPKGREKQLIFNKARGLILPMKCVTVF